MDVAILLKSQQELNFMEHMVELYNDFIRGRQLQKQQLEREIDALRKKRDNYDSISPL
jgi:hypothetical protein